MEKEADEVPMEKKPEPMEQGMVEEEVEEAAPMEECRIPVNGQPIVFEPSDALKNLYQDHPSTQVSFIEKSTKKY